VPRGPDGMIPGNATFALEEVLSAWARNAAHFETRAKSISGSSTASLLIWPIATTTRRGRPDWSLTRSMPFGLRCGNTGVRAARMALEEFQQNTVDAAYRTL